MAIAAGCIAGIGATCTCGAGGAVCTGIFTGTGARAICL